MSDCARVYRKRIMKFKGFLNQAYSFLCLRFTRLNRYFLQQEIRKLKIDRLHIGCGNLFLPGWLNTTYELREEYGRIKSINGALCLNYKLPNRLPVDDATIQYIASSHFIEHLDLNEGLRFFREAFRVMKKGGLIHTSCPSLDRYVQHYVNRNKDFFGNPLIREACTFKNARTPGSIFIAKAYDSGGAHRWFYDAETLMHSLETAGFQNVQTVRRLESQIPDIERIELPEREIETLYVEAEKL